MTYRELGWLSLALIAVAALTVYTTTPTSAQPPHAHNGTHDHQHDGHALSSDARPSAPVVVPAPSGGPPPLPSTAPQDAAPQRRPTPDSQADSPPTLLPPRSDEDYGCRQRGYTCPNVGRNSAIARHGDCPLDVDPHARPFEFRSPSDRPISRHTSHVPFDIGTSCLYADYDFGAYFGVVSRDYFREPCGHDLIDYEH